MTSGALLGAGMRVAWAHVRTVWQLYLIFAGLGVAMAMALYEAATPVLVSWFDATRRAKAILGMIVVAGFASAIFMPLTGWLTERYGWRTTLLALAGLYAAGAVPLHWLVVRRAPTAAAHPVRRTAAHRRTLIRAAMCDRRFWWLAAAFLAHAAAMTTMTVHLVGYLISRGHPATFAATVAGLLGVLSVTGRLLLTATARRIRLHRIVAAVFALQAAARRNTARGDPRRHLLRSWIRPRQPCDAATARRPVRHRRVREHRRHPRSVRHPRQSRGAAGRSLAAHRIRRLPDRPAGHRRRQPGRCRRDPRPRRHRTSPARPE
jgi:MFS family permease